MKNNSSSNVYRQILNGLDEMDEKELASQQGYFDLLKKTAISMLRDNEKIYPDIFAEDSDMTGCTNGDRILINTWSPVSIKVLQLRDYLESGEHNSWDDQLPKLTNVHQMMYLANVGLTCHELGHVLYTNFALLNEMISTFMDGNFDGCKEKEKLEKVYNSKFRGILQQVVKFLINSVEDGYIENCLALEYPATGNTVRGLQMSRDMLFFGSDSWLKSCENVLTGENLLVNAFCNGVLIDCVRGYKMKDYDACSGDVFTILDEALSKARPICRDYIISSKKHKENIYALLDIVATLLPDNPNNSPDPETGESNESSDSNESSNSQQDGKGKGKSKQQSQDNNQNGQNDGDKNDCQNQDGDSNGQNGSNGNQKTDTINNQQISDKSEEDMDKSMSKLGGKNGKGDIDEHNNNSSRRDPTKNSSKKQQKAADDAFRNAKRNDTVDNFIKEIAKGTAEQLKAEEQTEKLQEHMDEIRGYFRAGSYNVTGVRQKEVSDYDKTTYDRIYNPIKPIAKSCSRRINQLLKRREFDDEDSGYSFGNRLVSRDVYRKDRKCFSKELIPDEQPDVVFTIMVDESGSMSGMKERKAREAAILFDAIATETHIPARIVGHTTGYIDGGYRVVVNNYRNFESNGNEKYSLSKTAAENGNIDSVVLSGLCEELLSRPEEKKVVIVISDGAPCSATGSTRNNFRGVPYKPLGQYDDAASQELNACVRYYRKKGVRIIGVAIDEVEVIKRIYEDGTLDCTELNNLPREMVKLFKKYVLK